MLALSLMLKDGENHCYLKKDFSTGIVILTLNFLDSGNKNQWFKEKKDKHALC